MSSVFLLLAVLGGCGSSSDPPAQDGAATKARKAPGEARQAKGRPQRGAKAGGARAAGAGAPQAPLAPVGAAGPVLGTLRLVVTGGAADEGAPAGAEPAAAGTEPGGQQAADVAATPAGTAPAGAGGAQARAKPQTAASLVLSYGEGGETEVALGSVDGTCDQIEPVLVGPEGKQQLPLWAVRCGEAGEAANLYILQIGSNISVVREIPSSGEGVPIRYRPVKRVPLVKGAQLKRRS
ncbi:MAG TPA: hypothetical protein ENK18_20100 [Deltaproteobacteria bacterium]|nr:hypothetical protein [Deltaproteobacteria bacterium]